MRPDMFTFTQMGLVQKMAEPYVFSCNGVRRGLWGEKKLEKKTVGKQNLGYSVLKAVG